jgi:predicted protein tyrosine phosphatase
MRALFICSRNRLRSPTAETIFSTWPGIETDSAGLASDADVVLSTEQLVWADIIFVMERAHQSKLSRNFKDSLKGKKAICLDIPDRYSYMQEELIALLTKKAGSFLRHGQP